MGRARDFLSLALTTEQDECLLWPYAKNAKGYAVIFWDGVARIASRVLCELTHGPCPADKEEAAHRCGNAACMNKAHVRWATKIENADDRQRHGRHRSKLSESQAAAVLTSSVGPRELARQLGVSDTLICRIRSGDAWKRISRPEGLSL